MAKDVVTETVGDGGRSLFFIILSMVCFWFILDLLYGNKLISKLVDALFDSGSNSDPGLIGAGAGSNGLFTPGKDQPDRRPDSPEDAKEQGDKIQNGDFTNKA